MTPNLKTLSSNKLSASSLLSSMKDESAASSSEESDEENHLPPVLTMEKRSSFKVSPKYHDEEKEKEEKQRKEDEEQKKKDDAEEKMKSLVLRLVYAFTFFLAPVKDGLAPLVSVFLVVAEGWTPGMAGVIWFIRDGCSIVSNPFVGAIVDKSIRKRLLLVIATLITTFTACIVIWTQNFAVLCIKSILEGVTSTFIQPLKSALVLGLLGSETFHNASTKVEMFDHSGSFVVIIISGLVAYYSYPDVSSVFYVIGFGGLIASACLVFMPLYVEEEIDQDQNEDDDEDEDGKTIEDRRKSFAGNKKGSTKQTSQYRTRGTTRKSSDDDNEDADDEEKGYDNDPLSDSDDEDGENKLRRRPSLLLIKRASSKFFGNGDIDDDDQSTVSSRSLIDQDSSRNLMKGEKAVPYKEMFKNKSFVLYGISVFFFHLGNAAILPLMSQLMALDSGVRAGIPYTCANIAIAQLTSIPAAWLMGKVIRERNIPHKIPVAVGYVIGVPLRCILIILIDKFLPSSTAVDTNDNALIDTFDVEIDDLTVTLIDIEEDDSSSSNNNLGRLYAFLATQLLDGIGVGVYHLSIPLILEVLTKGTGHFSFSIGVINTSQQCGGALSNLVMGYVVTYLSYGIGFICCGILGSISIILIWLVDVTKKTATNDNTSDSKHGDDAAGDEEEAGGGRALLDTTTAIDKNNNCDGEDQEEILPSAVVTISDLDENMMKFLSTCSLGTTVKDPLPLSLQQNHVRTIDSLLELDSADIKSRRELDADIKSSLAKYHQYYHTAGGTRKKVTEDVPDALLCRLQNAVLYLKYRMASDVHLDVEDVLNSKCSKEDYQKWRREYSFGRISRDSMMDSITGSTVICINDKGSDMTSPTNSTMTIAETDEGSPSKRTTTTNKTLLEKKIEAMLKSEETKKAGTMMMMPSSSSKEERDEEESSLLLASSTTTKASTNNSSSRKSSSSMMSLRRVDMTGGVINGQDDGIIADADEDDDSL